MPTVNVAQDSEPELQEIADILGKSRKVVVVTGAGISTNCGIPDFRSENGLYSLIQAQYEAAVQNPPWEDTNSFENERPFKRRRASDRWYYEIVPNPVSEIDRNSSAQGRPRRSLRSRLSAEVTSGEITSSPSSFSDSSIIPLSSSHSFRSQPPTEDTPVDTTTTVARPSHNGICKLHQPAPDSVAAAPSTITNISALENDPPCRRRSLRSQSVSASTPKSSTSTTSASTPSCSSVADVLPLTRRITLQREASSCLTTQSDNDEPSSTQSSLSTSTRASLPNLKGRDLFDSMIWSDPLTTSIFYMFISSLRQKIEKDVTSTTETHKFIKALRDGGRLVRNYTQNIDALEAREGLCTELGRGPGNKARFQPKLQREPRPSEIREGEAHDAGVEVVMLHGSLVSLRCGLCAKLSSWDEGDRQTVTLAGKAPDCPSCAEYNAKREGKGRRSLAVGRLRPDIVLYGEEHPNAHLVAPLVTHDLALGPDVLLILGTSLRVHGLKVMVKEFAKAVHVRGGKVIFVNQTKPPESIWGDVIDYWVEWDCDEWVLDLKQRRGEIWLPQGSLEEQNKREAPLAEPKSESKKPYRPQALRDDKLNAVHFTFKILDTLRNIEDSYGQATRRIYFDKPPRKSNASILDSKLLIGVKAESLQAPTAPPKAAPKSKRGRSLPGCLRDEKRNGAYLITAMDRNCKLGEYVPGLRALPLKSRRDPLTETPANGVSTAPASFTYNSGKYHFPILAGLVQGMNLVSHPACGSQQLHSPRDFNNKGFRSYLHQPSSPCKLPPLLSPDTIIVDNRRASFPLLQPSQISSDTIVVEPPRPTQEQDQRDTFPTPPVSDPTTPSKRRIKSLGSIGAILSSPLDSAEKATELLHVYNDSE